MVAFGGQTAIKLTGYLDKRGVKILGTSADSIDMAEDRDRFEQLLDRLDIKRPEGCGVWTKEEALQEANRLGYPVLVRPSYVLGGQNMTIAFDDNDVSEFMNVILKTELNGPVLIDKYLMGTEVEVDAISDGENILIPGIMKHVERAGVHSGDSIAVYPAWSIGTEMVDKIVKESERISKALDAKGLVNIQYVIYNGELYVIEVNPRSSRTVPYLSKVTGVPMVDLAVECMLGGKLTQMGLGTGLYKLAGYVAVKVPVFSFEKLAEADISLGPEMKSTGEVLGIARTMPEAMYKGLTAAGFKLKKGGGVFFTARSKDQAEICPIAAKFQKMGFTVYATEGTAKMLEESGVGAVRVGKIHDSPNNALALLDAGKVDYVVSTTGRYRNATRDGVLIRKKAVERSIPCLTAIDTANALADCLMSGFTQEDLDPVDINTI